MKRLLRLLPLAALLISCNSSDRQFSLTGEFKNMNQADFYIYDAEKGWKDTIHVRNGRLEYEKLIRDTTTLIMMFPNYSQIPIFMRPGISIKMKGDASHLRETEVMGSEENEDMTEFRLKANKLTPPEVLLEARRYIIGHLESPVSFYLLQRYFLQTASPEYPEAYRMAKRIADAGGGRMAAKMVRQLAILKNAAEGSQLPVFATKDTNGETVSNRQLQSDVNVVCLWASWDNESKSQLRQLRKLQKRNKGRISVVSISVDANKADCEKFLERDSIDWPNICDGKMWQCPIAVKLGLAALPANIVTDKKGKIVARNLTTSHMKEKIEGMLDKQ